MSIELSPAVRLARDLARLGDGKDKVLAHLDPDKAVLLAKLSGGSVNKITGLPQFGFFDSITGIFGGNSSSNDPGTSQLNELTSYTAPLKNAADQQLGQYSSGQLNTGDQLSLNQAAQSAKAVNNQYYASAGLGNSSQLANAQGQVSQNTAINHQQMLNQYLSNASGLYNTILQPYSSALSNQYQASQQAQSTLASGIGGLFGSLGGASGIGSSLSGLFGKAGSGLSSLFGGGSSAGVDAGASYPTDVGLSSI